MGPPLLQRNCCKHCSISGVIQTDYQSTFGNLVNAVTGNLDFQVSDYANRELTQILR
jgi:hypothetical protein